MGKGSLNGPMKAISKENLLEIISKEVDFMYEVMEDNIKGNGNIIKCMVLGRFNGQMEENILDRMKTIRSMDMENSFGLMEENI